MSIPIFVTLMLGLLGSGGLVGWYVAVRKDRREDRTSNVDMSEKMLTRQAQMYDRMNSLEDQVSAERRERIETSDHLADATRRLAAVEARFSRVLAHVRVFIEWLDSGAEPPPPSVTEELRRLADE